MDIAVSPPHKMSGGGKKVAAHDWVIMTVLIVNDICHDVKYDHTKKKSGTYKLYLKPFSNGTPEEWLRFKNKIKIVTDGNGLLHFWT